MLDICIKVAQGIYLWYQQGYNPPQLRDNMLAVFQAFKSAYDAKNADKLSKVISDSYSGSLYGTKNKTELWGLFKGTFNTIPLGFNPSLTINIYQITEDNKEVFQAVIDFQSNICVLFVPFKHIDSDRVFIEVRPEKPYGIWKITRIEKIQE